MFIIVTWIDFYTLDQLLTGLVTVGTVELQADDRPNLQVLIVNLCAKYTLSTCFAEFKPLRLHQIQIVLNRKIFQKLFIILLNGHISEKSQI